IKGIEGTKLDDYFLDMKERKIDLTNQAVSEILLKATEYIQPNPGGALIEMGKAMKLMAEVKESFDINVRETFIDPLQLVHNEDLKQISHHLERLEGRRLDYDYKRKLVGKIPNDEITLAMEKFKESKDMAERSMFHFLENDIEQLNQLAEFVQAALDYHQQSANILQMLQRKLRIQITAASTLGRRNFRPQPLRRYPSALNVSAASSKASGPWSVWLSG
ncbi:LOW QUALITY PROTEIN: endophilin-A3-like, partial [Pipistrellus kuhlii]|uniref:LOW QUALITY PROTEIN: endophilin-A3-like n=1 Tax=Pipistrellus kuhlii TaxID=59472 RepID=UPI001E272F83